MTHSRLTAGVADSLLDVPGIRVGHWTDADGGTGCTVILCTDGAVAGVDVRGGAPGTRETDLLRPEKTVNQVHAILFCGGSAFGLAAADGVMRWLEETGVGFDTGVARVPIVPSAVLYDLVVGSANARPTREAGYRACKAASVGILAQGNVGAGTGATVGKVLGIRNACMGGLGSASVVTERGLVVAALAVVNAFGNIRDWETGKVVAGARIVDDEGRFVAFADAVETLANGNRLDFAAANTTLGLIATNGRLNKAEATRVAQMGHNGLARVIRPLHTSIDGDVVFALSNGDHVTDADVVGAIGADVLSRAVLNGVRAACSAYGLPCASDLPAHTTSAR